MGRRTVRSRVVRVDLSEGAVRRAERPDTLVVEEPLELRVAGRPLSVTMRTPGDDMDLAAGFLLTEGVVGDRKDLCVMRYCAGVGPDGRNTYNLLDVELAPHVPPPARSLDRWFATTSACGVCGKASIDAIRTITAREVRLDPVRLDAALLVALPDQLRAAQRVFEHTGGLHAAALFEGTTGRLLALREDVGRHNAVDKVVGWALREGLLPLSGTVLLVSGRASFELVQKALAAGVPALAAVSAPSSLAVELAAEAGMTLVGFLRGETMNVYAGAHRVHPGGPP
ncbi:MAG: formate dehydrogenase accessory sulfurtransferase FdhD [Frankiaceae bacterium]